MSRRTQAVLWLLFTTSLAACEHKPEPIAYGSDDCAHCKMRISDKNFGAEIITSKGRILKFDAIECLAGYYREHIRNDADVHSMWTIDYARPQTWVRTDSAYFLQSPNLPSPMGMFLSSFGSREDVERVKEKHTGRIVDWNQVLGLVETAKRARMEN